MRVTLQEMEPTPELDVADARRRLADAAATAKALEDRDHLERLGEAYGELPELAGE